jgi:hypothetical protein
MKRVVIRIRSVSKRRNINLAKAILIAFVLGIGAALVMASANAQSSVRYADHSGRGRRNSRKGATRVGSSGVDCHTRKLREKPARDGAASAIDCRSKKPAAAIELQSWRYDALRASVCRASNISSTFDSRPQRGRSPHADPLPPGPQSFGPSGPPGIGATPTATRAEGLLVRISFHLFLFSVLALVSSRAQPRDPGSFTVPRFFDFA